MAEKNQKHIPKDNWDKAAILAGIVGGIGALAIPIVVVIYGSAINTSLKQSEAEIKMVELAIGVLTQPTTAEDENDNLRDWAFSVLDQYSTIPLPAEAREELAGWLPPWTGLRRDDSGNVLWSIGPVFGSQTTPTQVISIEDATTGRRLTGSVRILVGDDEVVRDSDDTGFVFLQGEFTYRDIIVTAPGYVERHLLASDIPRNNLFVVELMPR